MWRVLGRYNWIVLGIYGFLADRICKHVVLKGGTYIINEGVSFGFNLGKSTDYIVVIAMFLLLWATLGERKYLWLSFFGALGNVLDRWLYGGVVDYIKMGSFPWFNVADFVIVLGLCLWVMKEIGLLPE
ncbi:MAG TPA: signal peptidase II [Coprothermobacter sp.]|jgi:signal peptidase II|nr:signal peptidase II [Coprothermobacter sp.]